MARRRGIMWSLFKSSKKEVTCTTWRQQTVFRVSRLTRRRRLSTTGSCFLGFLPGSSPLVMTWGSGPNIKLLTLRALETKLNRGVAEDGRNHTHTLVQGVYSDCSCWERTLWGGYTSRATERSEGCLEGVTTLLLVTVATSTTQLKPKATEKRREEYTIYSPPSSILYCIADYVKLLTNSAIMQISTGASINGVVLRGLSCI